MNEKTSTISEIVKIEYLTPDNAVFSATEFGFVSLKTNGVPNPDRENITEEIFFDRIYLHRAFPFDNPDLFISVQGAFPQPPKKEEPSKDSNEKSKDSNEKSKDGNEKSKGSNEKSKDDSKKKKDDKPPVGEVKEIGVINNINDFDGKTVELLKHELNRKYFTPVIEKITSIKERYGYSYWVVTTALGEVKFTIHDTFRNIKKINDDRIYIYDINGNRYEIPSLLGFDRKSYRKIELYL